MRILIVETRVARRRGALALEAGSQPISSAAPGARSALQTESFDLLILDIGLAKRLRLLQGLRNRGKILPC